MPRVHTSGNISPVVDITVHFTQTITNTVAKLWIVILMRCSCLKKVFVLKAELQTNQSPRDSTSQVVIFRNDDRGSTPLHKIILHLYKHHGGLLFVLFVPSLCCYHSLCIHGEVKSSCKALVSVVLSSAGVMTHPAEEHRVFPSPECSGLRVSLYC